MIHFIYINMYSNNLLLFTFIIFSFWILIILLNPQMTKVDQWCKICTSKHESNGKNSDINTAAQNSQKCKSWFYICIKDYMWLWMYDDFKETDKNDVVHWRRILWFQTVCSIGTPQRWSIIMNFLYITYHFRDQIACLFRCWK